VHSLKATLRSDSEFAYNGPKGQLVRDIAGSDLGKDAAVFDDGDGIEIEAVDTEDDADRHGSPDHAAANGHGKKDKPNKKPHK
jgi:hypothetical protein